MKIETHVLKNTFLNDQQVTEEIKEIQKYLETKGSKSTTQNLWDALKVLEEFIAIQAYFKK